MNIMEQTWTGQLPNKPDWGGGLDTSFMNAHLYSDN